MTELFRACNVDCDTFKERRKGGKGKKKRKEREKLRGGGGREKRETFARAGRLNFPPSSGESTASAVLSNYSKLLRRVRALKGLN